MSLSLREFASQWKLNLTRVTIVGPKGLIETDAIQGTHGFIYEHSHRRLAYDSWPESGVQLNRSGPFWFEPRGYPGDKESFSTQHTLVNELGIYPRAVPLLNLAECEREMDAYGAMLNRQTSREPLPSNLAPKVSEREELRSLFTVNIGSISCTVLKTGRLLAKSIVGVSRHGALAIRRAATLQGGRGNVND